MVRSAVGTPYNANRGSGPTRTPTAAAARTTAAATGSSQRDRISRARQRTVMLLYGTAHEDEGQGREGDGDGHHGGSEQTGRVPQSPREVAARHVANIYRQHIKRVQTTGPSPPMFVVCRARSPAHGAYWPKPYSVLPWRLRA